METKGKQNKEKKITLSVIIPLLSLLISFFTFRYNIKKDINSNKEQIHVYMTNMEPIYFDNFSESIFNIDIKDIDSDTNSINKTGIPTSLNLVVTNNSSHSISIIDMRLNQFLDNIDLNTYAINASDLITRVIYNDIEYDNLNKFPSQPIFLNPKESAVIYIEINHLLPSNIIEVLQNYGQDNIWDTYSFLEILSENNLDIYGNKLDATYTLKPNESITIFSTPKFRVEFITTSGKCYWSDIQPYIKTSIFN